MEFDSSDPTYPVEVFLSVLEHEASAQGIDRDNGELVAFAISFMVRLSFSYQIVEKFVQSADIFSSATKKMLPW